ncbi:MAG: hypothetical protein KGH59_01820 [Candidatus Micrarchaeota archaeon]|nr:hypothetical protein [Candidatus Micrarchaeota archaeon]MDE1804501.1 hypothetical protein [Candidatus Micrarchaeota archaeon]
MPKSFKLSGVDGQQYLVMKVLQTPMVVDPLSKSARKEVAELSALGLVETPTYSWEGKQFSCVESVKVLSEAGRALMGQIRDSPQDLVRLEKEKEKLVEEGQKEVSQMWKKLFPNFAPK